MIVVEKRDIGRVCDDGEEVWVSTATEILWTDEQLLPVPSHNGHAVALRVETAGVSDSG